MVILNRFHDAEWQGENCPDEFEQCTQGKPYDAERQKNKPDDREEDEKQNSYWPAQNEQQAPKNYCKKSTHIDYFTTTVANDSPN